MKIPYNIQVTFETPNVTGPYIRDDYGNKIQSTLATTIDGWQLKQSNNDVSTEYNRDAYSLVILTDNDVNLISLLSTGTINNRKYDVTDIEPYIAPLSFRNQQTLTRLTLSRTIK